MMQNVVTETLTEPSVMDLEEQVCDLSNLAELAFDYILPLLRESLTGLLTEARVDSASYVLTEIANKAGSLKALSYALMERPKDRQPRRSDN